MAKAPKEDITTKQDVDTTVVTDPPPPAPDATVQDAATDAPDLLGTTDPTSAAGADNPGPTADELAAAAEAQAEAQAKADAEAAAAAQAQATEAPPPDVERLQLLVGQIERLNHTGHRLGLTDELVDVYGMEWHWDDAQLMNVTLAGIAIDPAPTMEIALNNWASAARRVIMEQAG